MREQIPILTVDEASRETIDPKTPLIIRGASDRARAKWTDAWLIEFMGDRRCVVSLDSRPRLAPNRKERLLSEFLETQPLESSGGEPPMDGRDLEYLFHAEVDAARASELVGDLDLPPAILQLGTARLFQLFVGPAWSGTLPHCHERAINALARGRKRWAIYVGRDKRETEALRKESYDAYGSGSQAASWFAAECEKLSARGIRFWEFIQDPGDVVYIPTFYLHAVMNLEPVVGFSAELHGKAKDKDKILSAQCMTGPYMEAGARRLLPYMEKHGLGQSVLELGPSRHPLATPDTCGCRIVYVEISDPVLQFLRDRFGDSVAIVKFDLNRAWDNGSNALGRELGESLHRDPAVPVRFDSLILSQIVNYVDLRGLLQACAALAAANATLFFNNIMNHGADGLFHAGRPKDLAEFLDAASTAGFDPVEVVTEPAGVADAEKVRHLAVLRRRA